MTSNQISTVQNSVKLVRGLAIVLPAVALLLFALCVYLYTGRRRHALWIVGIDLVIAGRARAHRPQCSPATRSSTRWRQDAAASPRPRPPGRSGRGFSREVAQSVAHRASR